MPRRLGARQLAQIESRLRTFFTDLAEDLEELEADTSMERGVDAEDEGDTAADEALLGVSIAIMNRERDTLHAVVEALAKLERGNYGLCEDCDTPIPAERLMALPWAPRCVPCMQEYERDFA